MEYQAVINIDNNIHDEFVKQHPLCNLLQSSSWAKIKDNWDNFLFSVVDSNNNVVASSLVLVKIVKGFSIYYIPRGPIMDYSNKEVVSFYFNELKQYAKKHKCIFIKFDPGVIYKEYLIKDQQEANVLNQEVINTLISVGAKYHGLTTYIKESFQPRFIMGVKQDCFNEEELPRRTAKSLRSAIKHQVKVDVYDRSYLDEFARLMQLTEDRKQVSLRNIEYYHKLLDTYPETGYLYLASVDLQPRLEELTNQQNQLNAELNDENTTNKRKKKINQELEVVNKELKETKELVEKYPNKEFISGGIMVGFGDQMEMLYAGMNDDFKHFYPQYLLYTTQFKDAFNQGYSFCSMGGVEGTLDDGLSIYKSAYSPHVVEYIGEFDIVLNKFMYQAYKILMKLR